MLTEQTQSYAPSPEAYARVSWLSAQLEGAGAVKAVVVGAGKSGLAAAHLLVARGASVTLADDRAASIEALPEPLQSVPVVALSAELCDAADLVVLSPGVPRSRPELAGSIEAGRLVGELELASWFLHMPMVGITGTNGKSTTTVLVAHMLEQAYPGQVFAGGNLGRPLSQLALDPAGVRAVAAELSSYQLESIVQAKFGVACWLNLSPDHTDRYESLTEYGAAKARLLERRAVNGCAVLNAKDPACAQAGLSLGGAVRWFAATPTSDLAESMGTLLAEPELAVRVDGAEVESYRLDNPALIGLHNKANALAAIECARWMGVAPAQVQLALSTFSGLAHRLEWVCERDGIEWRNDSKATNIDSALTAVRALERPIVLIAGGRDKGAPWAPLVEASVGRVKRVIAIGEASPLVQAAFEAGGIAVELGQTLGNAVKLAAQRAVLGDVVLLSPACASYDQFPNFEVRGEEFKALVMGAGEQA